MSELLYIEGSQVDLTPNTINRTLQINNIGEAKDRQSNFSNTNKLPRTPKNIKIFNFLGVSGNKSDFPYKKLSCDYIKNGIPLVRNGYAVVKATNSHYEVVIYDGIIDVSERIKGKKLNELNFADLNHYLTQSNYQNSFSNTEGYIYALGEFIPRSSFSNVTIQEQAPSLFVKTIWDKIWNEAGLSYFGEFFTVNEDFQTEVVSAQKGYTIEDIELISTALGSGNTNLISRFANSNDPLIRFEDQHTFTSEGYTGISTNPDGSLLVNADKQIKLSIATSYSNNESYVRLQIRINGSTKTSILLDKLGTSKNSEISLSVAAGDLISFVISGTYDIDQAGNEFFKYIIDYSASSVIEITEQTGGQFIDFSLFTSNMDQLTFVKDVMQRYGLILKPVKNTNAYEFIQFEKLLNAKENTEDWSDKLDVILGEKYDIQYAQVNDATYNYPEELVDHLYDGILTIDNQNATPNKNLFASPYEIANTRPRTFNGKSIYQVHIWEEKQEDGVAIIAKKETPIKIFRLSKVQMTINTFFFDNVNTVAVTGAIPFLSLENMQMQYFLNVYYKAFKILINRTKQVDARFLMNEIDIFNLDFFTLKYLEQTGKYYYLNNLKHSADKLSPAELIELSGFSVNLPPTVLGVFQTNISYENTRAITVANITDQSNPAYFDPEFDEPIAIMITGGFNSNILIKNGAQILTTQTEILVENWDLKIEDAGNTVDAHSANYTFKIKDAGSGKYSEVEGTISVSVAAYVNNPPVANAGPDQTVQIPANEFNSFFGVSGSGSTDTTGEITTYNWVLISKPVGSTAFVNFANDVNASLEVPNSSENIGAYTIELTVTDNFGATATDTVSIQIQPA